MNTVNQLGILTRDPEIKYVGNDAIAKCSFSIAVNDKGKNYDKTYFFNCEAWGKIAETINKYVSKGQRLLISNGKLKQETYTDKEGNKKQSVVIVVNEFDFIESANNKNDENEKKDETFDTYDYGSQEETLF